MKTVHCPPLGRAVSVMGFGCASLGSRISPEQGNRALAQATDLGVNWIDVAPPYGDGQAEAILGRFLKGRRDGVVLCTKVGIARPQVSRAKAFVRSILRPIVEMVPAARQLIRRGRGPAMRAPLTGPGVLESLEASLRELQTDYVDVLALHDPDPDEVRNHELLTVLETVVTSGKARALSIAGSFEVGLQGLGQSRLFDVVQFPLAAPYATPRLMSQARPDAFVVIHSVLGSGALEAMSLAIQGDPALTSRLAALGYEGPSTAGDVLLDLALAENDRGVVLMSMFQPSNIQRNIARAARPMTTEALVSLRSALQTQAGASQ